MILRDIWHLRGQLIATALVVMCGVASFVSMRCTYDSLRIARDAYYQDYRFANVFARGFEASCNERSLLVLGQRQRGSASPAHAGQQLSHAGVEQ